MCQSLDEDCCNEELDDECVCCGCFRKNGCCRCCCCCCGIDFSQCKCPPECCIRLFACLNPARYCTYGNMITLFRFFFLLLHTLLVATSIFGLIWSNVYFDDFDHILTGSIIGGHLVTLSAAGLLFGLSGLYASIKRHRRLLYTHAIITWTVLLLRGFTWLLSMLHEYRLDPLIYGLAPIEFALAALSTALLRDALVYY